MMLLLSAGFLLLPITGAQANPLDEMCPGEPAPLPESAGVGSDGLLVPPQSQDAIDNSPEGLPPDSSMYGQYGTAGTQWHMITETCIDGISEGAQATLSNTAWDLSKTINQSTITVYQAATSDGLLSSLTEMVEDGVAALRDGVWRPLIPTLIILGTIWLGWYGLIKRRMTLTLESSLWMILATAMGMWILVQPATVMGLANSLVNSGTQLVTSAVGQIPNQSSGAGVCPANAQQAERADWESEADYQVRRNADMLWSSLVCQPWVAGQFGSGVEARSAEFAHGTDLMAAQGITRVEQQQIIDEEVDAVELMSDKQDSYSDIAGDIEENYASVYPLFSGEDPGSRIGVASLALFSSIFAGGLILAASVALIVLKIAFLLLFLLAPIFFLIGIHPGYGRMVLLRWLELIVGLLLKQIFIVMLISLLVMAYGMIMSSNLGWGLQMILLALFTLALFIYRKPFAHLFSSVNANSFTSRVVSDAAQSQALGRSAAVLPPVAYARAQNWGRRRAPQLAAGAAGTPAGNGTDQPVPQDDAPTPDREPARARARGGYGRVRGNDAPPPLNVNRNGGSGGGGPRPGPGPGGRSTEEAPNLRGSQGSSIPPRPSGGYTGTGDSGWGGVFGTAPGGRSDGSRSNEGSGGGFVGGVPAGGGRAAAAERPAPGSGRGIFQGREDTPPQGALGGQSSRWGAPREKRERKAPPRQPRQAPAAPSKRGDGEGSWLTGSNKRNDNAPITPFWGEGGSGGTRDRKRDVPFWLNDD
ncbi:type IV secretion system protein [Nocardiopsis sp. HNM0947]|uniref:Type IV secretion system protein n=2 Tax=Nocardiopsis coralli TaxID=2772213 RepID=A0ABR9P8F4_9ACTN|nr:type IV secretion system protein [Nocardiopsis coralli]